MNTFSNLTTATEIQRDYKAVSKRARSSDEALIVMLNNKPDLAVMKYDLYQHLIDNSISNKRIKKLKKDNDFSEFLGLWTKEEADEFNRVIEEEFEQVDPQDWR